METTKTERIVTWADIDENLHLRIATQSEQGLEELIQVTLKLTQIVYGKIKEYGSWEDAEDITADLFLAEWSGSKFDPDKSPLSCKTQNPNNEKYENWLTRVAVRKAIDFIRSKQTARKYHDRFFKGMKSEQYLIAEAEDRIDKQLEKNEIRVVIDSLDEIHKTVIYMRYIEDLSLQEIGVRIGKSVGTVKSRLSRARNQIRRVWLQK